MSIVTIPLGPTVPSLRSRTDTGHIDLAFKILSMLHQLILFWKDRRDVATVMPAKRANFRVARLIFLRLGFFKCTPFQCLVFSVSFLLLMTEKVLL